MGHTCSETSLLDAQPAPSLGAAPDPDASIGDARWSALHYELELDVLLSPPQLLGTARISGLATAPLPSIEITLTGLRPSAVRVDGVAARYARDGARLTIAPPSPIPHGRRFALEIDYAGAPSSAGAAGWHGDACSAVVAPGAGAASTWFPCNDRPAEKATFRIRITAHASLRSVATGTLVDERTMCGRTSRTFDCTTPAAPGLVTVHVARSLRCSATAGEVAVTAAFPGSWMQQSLAGLGRVPAMLSCFAERFGPYPFDTHALVVSDRELPRPLVAQGMTILGSQHLDGTGRGDLLLARALAHQWFGCSVGTAALQHRWLDAALGRYATWLWLEATGETGTDALAAAEHDRLAGLPGLALVAEAPGEPAPDPDDRVASRGALLVHSVRIALGDVRFFDLLQDWTALHIASTVTTDDFRRLVAQFAPEPLDALLAAWLDDAALPPMPARRSRASRHRHG